MNTATAICLKKVLNTATAIRQKIKYSIPLPLVAKNSALFRATATAIFRYLSAIFTLFLRSFIVSKIPFHEIKSIFDFDRNDYYNLKYIVAQSSRQLSYVF